MVRLVLFDFDGTIADTLDAGLDIYNENAEKAGLTRILSMDGLRDLSMAEFFKKFRIPVYKVPFFMRQLQVRLNKRIDKVNLFNGMDKVIRKLHKDFRLAILSSNSEKNIRKFLKAKDLEKYFSFVMGYNHLFGKSSAIRKIAAKERIGIQDIVYVGDEVRDILSTRKIKVQMVAVSWGYNSPGRLRKERPEWIVDNPEEIIEIIKGL